ncbi:MAG: hypothetical protein JSV10_00645 [Candidatus Zixiibacteriota bacterium]|nr:MAG: hypothetical protein JSV10_00645 [candidate division Zixibacteria bacterium]
MFRDVDEAVGRAMAYTLGALINNSSEIVGLTLGLAWAIKEKDGDALGELLENHRFLPAGMSKDEYIESLLQANTTLIIETDSIKVALFRDGDEITTMSIVLSPGAADTVGMSYSREDSALAPFDMSALESDSLSTSFVDPTRATVHTSMLVLNGDTGDTVRIDNSIFFEKEKEHWLIMSFRKDLLQLVGARTDSGKE